MKKRYLSVALAALMFMPAATTLSGCAGDDPDIILKVYNWEEYIDEGGDGTFIFDELHEFDDEGEPVKDASGKHVHIESDAVNDDFFGWYEETMGQALSEEGPAIIDDFQLWYEKTYGVKVQVEYSTFGTNEDMYNEIVLGNEYDLICPSDYMIMKLAAEGKLEKYDNGRDENDRPDGSYDFFDESIEENYYIRNVSPFIREKFETNAGLEGKNYSWSEYAAGYMWGTTGFVYNPEIVSEEELEALDWQVFITKGAQFTNKITAKDNVRDTYFAALGVALEKELTDLLGQFKEGTISAEEYITAITAIFNDTSEETIARVEPVLMQIKQNIYSFETDTGKADLVNGNINLNYAWSGDAVYAMDLAEEENDRYFNYFVPASGSNLWFDGWVMPKGVTERGTKHAAQAFVNFLSMPYNAMRNSYYIGYTSAISGENMEMLDYVDYLYGEEEPEEESEDIIEYELSWFFGADASIFADAEQATKRQLFAQYPPEDVMARCAVMDYYGDEASVRINELWSRVKSETLDAWAIVVICITVVAIILFVVFIKFGNKIQIRSRAKKGYKKINE